VKTFLNFSAIALAGSLSLGVVNTRADLEVSASFSVHAEADFQAPLATHGSWIEVGSYGRCWRPASVAVEWRPYCSGHWVWTDCGWYWESDEPWAWACYHYGYWVYDPVHAWIWIPGIEWAPAWVSWRVGGGYIGWAPLPPPRVTVAVGAPHFVFVASSRFHDPVRPSGVIVNNTTIINQTTVINNVKHETRTIGGAGPRKVVVNEGPGLEVVQKATGKQVKPVPIQEAASKASVPREVSRGSGETKDKAKPSVAPSEQPKAAPDRKAAPDENRGRPVKPAPPKKGKDKPDKPRGKEEASFAPSERFTPAPERNAAPGENRSQSVNPTVSNIEKDNLRGREKPSFTSPEQRRFTPERTAAPGENQGPSVKPAPPDRSKPGQDRIVPSPGRPPATSGSRASRPSKESKGMVPEPKKSREKDKP